MFANHTYKSLKKSTIAEDIKHLIEKLYKIFTREADKGGLCDILELTKDELLTLWCKDDSGVATNLIKVEVGRIRMLLHLKNSSSDKGLHPAYGSLRWTSIDADDQHAFRTRPENLTELSQSGDIRVPTPRNILHPDLPKHEHTLAVMLKKIITRDAFLFSKFKDKKF